MKSIFLLAFFVFVHLSVLFGQSGKYQFGLQIHGASSVLNYHNAVSSSSTEYYQYSAASRFSPGASLLGQYKINEQVQLQLGLGYELSGYRIKPFDVYKSTPQMPEPELIGKTKATIHYQDLLVWLHAKIIPAKRAAWFYLVAGISNHFNLGRKRTIVLDNYVDGTVTTTNEDIPKGGRTIHSWVPYHDFGFGFDFKAFQKVHFFLEPIYGYTLVPVIIEGNGKFGQYTIGLNLGFVL